MKEKQRFICTLSGKELVDLGFEVEVKGTYYKRLELTDSNIINDVGFCDEIVTELIVNPIHIPKGLERIDNEIVLNTYVYTVNGVEVETGVHMGMLYEFITKGWIKPYEGE